MISERTKAILRHVKSTNYNYDWKEIPVILAEQYHIDMSIQDVLHHVCCAFDECRVEPRFELGYQIERDKLFNSAINQLGLWPGLKDSFTVEQFYNAYITNMLSTIRLTRADWCKEEVWGSNA